MEQAMLRDEIPSADAVRLRMVRVATELALLRRLLPLAASAEEERDRLQKLALAGGTRDAAK